MAAKSSDWRQPGSNVCRCCFADGCYKDISTEYFWMGKREVYSEMLTETFDVNISYTKSGGPNSNSRLICEPCISRLRDATDFKKQVVECEKTFMQCLDPGRSNIELEGSSADKSVKVEYVKLEKELSDDDFDDIGNDGFGDDDDEDDDLDDQPLTKLASKIPKKESVDLMDLLDNDKAAQKRKASAPGLKIVVTKKAKTKKDAKPVASKVKAAPAKPEKKKKGKEEVIKKEVKNVTEAEPSTNIVAKKDAENERRAAFRNNIAVILEFCTAYPFRYRKGTYLCFFCKETFLEPEKLREHTRMEHGNVRQMKKPENYQPLKMDFAHSVCTACGVPIGDYAMLKSHLSNDHGKHIDCSQGECVLPYTLSTELSCQICGKRCEKFLSLHKHMNEHYENFVCDTCGKRFATSQRMRNHARLHQRGVFHCKHCEDTFPSYTALHDHIAKVHRSTRYKCPICDEKLATYRHRVIHLDLVHGQKAEEFPCPHCTKVFSLCSNRTAHIKSQHLKERNHVCPVCGMKFFSKYELKGHSIKHGGERIHQCEVCKKRYPRLKTLKEHMRIHNNDRRYVCNICGQSFVQNCSLKNHMRVHHPID